MASRELVLLGPGCPDCAGVLGEYTMDEPALFAHGGYGATRHTTWAVCHACRWALERSVTEVRPAERPARLGYPQAMTIPV